MRELFDDLRKQLQDFVEQRQQAVLVVSAGTREYVALCAALNGLDQGGSPHVFSIFGEAFERPTQYASALISAFQGRHRELVAASDLPVPPLPENLLEVETDPVLRLRALFTFARSLIPRGSGLLLVAALAPATISDGAGYERFVDELLQHDPSSPWCSNMRFIVRELPGLSPSPVDRPRAKHVRCYKPDLSDDALSQALAKEANDEARPLAQRMQSLMVMAGLDSSHRRTEQALEKYELLARYHLGMGDLPALALALNGMGEACALAQRRDEARIHFERALTPAVEAEDVPSLSSITYNLARLHQGNGDWATACEYYAALSQLARAALNAVLLVLCHEQHGECLFRQRAYEEASQAWRAGLTLADGMGMPDQKLWISLRMRELLTVKGLTSELRELDREIAKLRQAGAQEPPG